MKQDEVMRLLAEYRENVARCAYLQIEIDENEKAIADACRTAIEDAATPSAQRLTGMPSGGKIGNPTEEIALMIASGVKPEWVREMENDVVAMRAEFDRIHAKARRVDAWLNGLNARERWVITGHVIDHCSWKELLREYELQFGEPRTKRNLQNVKARALSKIFHAAA